MTKSKINAAVLHVNPGNANAQTPTMTIARVLAETLELPLLHGEATVKVAANWNKRYDVLFVKPGVLRFCSYRDAVFELIGKADEIIIVDNDPMFEVDKRLVPHDCVSYWTTTPINVKDEYGQYVNWNRATWQHEARLPISLLGVEHDDALVYHGRYRPDRHSSFDRYFSRPQVKTVVRCQHKAKAEFERYHPAVICHVDKQSDILELGQYKAGLYIEDDFSHSTFTSLAQRFYEYLQVGLPIVFDAECAKTCETAGLIRYEEFTVDGTADVARFMRQNLVKVAHKQADLWYRDYKAELRSDVRAAARKHFGWKV